MVVEIEGLSLFAMRSISCVAECVTGLGSLVISMGWCLLLSSTALCSSLS